MSTGKAVPNIVAEWIKKEFIQKMLLLGIHKIAILLENNALRRLFIENIKESFIITGIQFQIFNLRSDMDQWMNEKEIAKKPIVSKNQESTFNNYF